MSINTLDFSNQKFDLFYNIYKSKGINMSFVLDTVNPDVMDLNPFNNNLTDLQKDIIKQECKDNIWYFVRKAIKFATDKGPSSINIIMATIIYVSEVLHKSLYLNHQKSSFASTTLDIIEIYNRIFGRASVIDRYNNININPDIMVPKWLLEETPEYESRKASFQELSMVASNIEEGETSYNVLQLIDNAETDKEKDILKIYNDIEHNRSSKSRSIIVSHCGNIEDVKDRGCIDIILKGEIWTVNSFNYYSEYFHRLNAPATFYARYPLWEFFDNLQLLDL